MSRVSSNERQERPGRARRRVVWLVPVLVAGAVGAGVVLSTSSPSGATPSLRPLSVQQLLVAVQKSSTTALSGTVSESVHLGLPSLPGGQSDASLSWQSFLTGSHTARVWADGVDNQRVAVLGQLSEADVVHRGKDVWTYTSSTNSVSHTVLSMADHQRQQPIPGASDYTPAGVAARLLDAITPSTKVSVDTARTVAGRPAYTVALRPRDARSTVRVARIAIDARTFVPLQVQLFGAGSTPVLDIGFTTISFARPASSIFDFKIPAGASVSSDPLTLSPSSDHHRARASGTLSRTPAAQPRIIGTGWTSVVEMSGSNRVIGQLGGGMFDKLTSAVGSSGQRLLHTALINAVVMPDGRVFIGAVGPALLEHIAATAR